MLSLGCLELVCVAINQWKFYLCSMFNCKYTKHVSAEAERIELFKHKVVSSFPADMHSLEVNIL